MYSENNWFIWLKLNKKMDDDFKAKIGLSGRNQRQAGRNHGTLQRRGRPSPMTETAIRSQIGHLAHFANGYHDKVKISKMISPMNILKNRLEEVMKTVSTWLSMCL